MVGAHSLEHFYFISSVHVQWWHQCNRQIVIQLYNFHIITPDKLATICVCYTVQKSTWLRNWMAYMRIFRTQCNCIAWCVHVKLIHMQSHTHIYTKRIHHLHSHNCKRTSKFASKSFCFRSAIHGMWNGHVMEWACINLQITYKSKFSWLIHIGILLRTSFASLFCNVNF